MLSSNTFSTTQVLGISGSPTPSSRSTALLRMALRTLASSSAALGELELRDLPPAALLRAEVQHPQIATAIAKVSEADVVLVATPIYKASYSGLLKAFLDVLPQDALRGKLVLPLATGGSAAHLLALDYALKPVLSALGARYLLDSVYATDAQFETCELHGRRPGAEVQARLLRALQPLLKPAQADALPAGPAGLRMRC